MTIIFQPGGKRIDVDPDTNLLDAGQQAGAGLAAVCGGIGICGECRVNVIAGQVTPATMLEEDHLTPDEIASGVRLACQTAVLTGDAIIEVPPESMRVARRVLVDGQVSAPSGDAHSLLAIHDLTATPATIHDLRGDWQRLTGLPPDCPVPAPGVLATLPALLRSHDWQVRLITHDDKPVAFLPPGTHPVGLAIDAGTTGLALYLVDMTDETLLIADGAHNPQISYGEDIMARLTTVMQSPQRARQMQTVLVTALNEHVEALCEQTGIVPEAIVDVVIVGNTAIHHLLLGLPVAQLGTAPYVPVVNAPLTFDAKDIGLTLAPGAQLYLPPVVAGFVGADHIAMLLAADIDSATGITLALDIGTNTEISLKVNDTILSCSAASGPAFEGAHIRDGMRAGAGAIERFAWHDGHLRWLTIEDTAPNGICGSGLIDVIGVLCEQDYLTLTGAFKADTPGYFEHGTYRGMMLVPADQTEHGRDIRLSRADVSEIQIAKGAIRAGIKLLTEHAGIGESDIEKVIIAGAFGNYINVEHAISIGLLPPLPLTAFDQQGNAAGAGARLLLQDASARSRAESLTERITYIELTTHPDFADRFSQAVLLTPMPWD